MTKLLVVEAKLEDPNPGLPVINLRADRASVAKRIWRGVAENGVEFGFTLEDSLKHGETFYQSDAVRYVVEQIAECVLQIPLDLPASAAAGIGWAVGNLHLEMSADAEKISLPDEPAARALLGRLGINFDVNEIVFRPGRFARGARKIDELGASHRH